MDVWYLNVFYVKMLGVGVRVMGSWHPGTVTVTAAAQETGVEVEVEVEVERAAAPDPITMAVDINSDTNIDDLECRCEWILNRRLMSRVTRRVIPPIVMNQDHPIPPHFPQ